MKASPKELWRVNLGDRVVELQARMVYRGNRMKNFADYEKYECPFSHIEKDCDHELHGPKNYENTYSVWCACGFRAPVFILDPDRLGLKLKPKSKIMQPPKKIWLVDLGDNVIEWCGDVDEDVEDKDIAGPYVLQEQKEETFKNQK